MIVKKTKEEREKINDFITRLQELQFTTLLNRSKKLYKDGDVVEAFVVLHTILEYELLYNWSSFVHTISGRGGSGIADDDKIQRKYMEHVQLFFEVGLLDKKGKGVFKNFNDGRNGVIHKLYHFKKGFDFNKKLLNGQFKDGLKAATIIKLDIYYKIINQYVFPIFKDPKAPWEFRTPKQSDLNKIAKKWRNLNDF